MRVLDCAGIGLNSGVIAGVDWVTGNHKAGQPAVANMSLGGGKSAALEQAVANSIADGVTYAVAAGNETEDACTGSPSGLAGRDHRRLDDEHRRAFELQRLRPVRRLLRAGLEHHVGVLPDRHGTATMSGTSMATPHVAGAAALYLQGSPAATPQQVRDGLFSLTTKGVVTDARSANNHLLFTNL